MKEREREKIKREREKQREKERERWRQTQRKTDEQREREKKIENDGKERKNRHCVVFVCLQITLSICSNLHFYFTDFHGGSVQYHSPWPFLSTMRAEN